ncbi:hypothetical protein GCM10022393_13380 [Aquimarina addita]|uniref:DUF6438 domain-containing protein n=2 Tax=Aquimarina addita TaxID=870485 RepID=A0ABP7XFK2_9FLAO
MNSNKRQSNIMVSKNPVIRSIDSSTIVLIVERGAFHYDKFVLKDTILSFYPDTENSINKDTLASYHTYSTQKVSKTERNQLIKKILESDFFNLKDTYNNQASCNSMLTITLSLGNKHKKILCDDFKRDCPMLLQYLESEIIRLHGYKLKRIFLPG